MADPELPRPVSERFRRRLDALGQAGNAYLPPKRLLRSLAIEPGNAKVGQVWRTKAMSEDAQTQGGFDPCWVVLLAALPATSGSTLYEAAPLFTATEWTGPEDLVLPRDLLGFSCAAALGTEVTILSESLLACEGELPVAWTTRLTEFRSYLQTPGTPIPDGVQTGLPFLDEADPAFEFHESLVERLDYLQEPVLAWLDSQEQPVPNWVEETTAALGSAWRSAAEWLREHAIEAILEPGFASWLMASRRLVEEGNLASREPRALCVLWEEDLSALNRSIAAGEIADNLVFTARVQDEPQEDPDHPGKCLARWQIEDAEAMKRLGEGNIFYVVKGDDSSRIIGGGLVQRVGEAVFANLEVGEWADFYGVEKLVLLFLMRP